MAKRYMVPAIKRAFELIELLTQQDSGLTISDIRQQMGLPLSSVATMVYTLHDLGYLERDSESSTYRLSVKLHGIASRVSEGKDVSSKCHKLLEEAVRETGLTGHISVLREGESMYIDRAQSDGFVQVSTYIGLRWPAHTSAAGKVLLAFLPLPDRERTLAKKKLKRLTPHTITSLQILKRQLATIVRTGYSWEQNEGEMGLGCVAAPLFGPGHELMAALSLTGTVHQISKAKIPSLGNLVRNYAREMSSRVGDHS
jgi:DNA-binding IclR family transcriptional regulator